MISKVNNEVSQLISAKNINTITIDINFIFLNIFIGVHTYQWFVYELIACISSGTPAHKFNSVQLILITNTNFINKY